MHAIVMLDTDPSRVSERHIRIQRRIYRTVTYGSIYHFPSFKATQRDVFSDLDQVAAAANAVGNFWGRVANIKGNMEEDNGHV